MMKVSILLEAVNRVTGPMRAVVASVEKLGAAYTATAAKVAAGARSITASADRAAGSLRTMATAAMATTRNFQAMVGPAGLARASRGVETLRREVGGLSTGLSILKFATVGAVIGLGEEFVRGVYTAGGESQRMLVTLTKLEGSATRARQAMSWMQSFGMGAGSAFSMPDIMRSYQMATNFGMSPQSGSLAAFADLAAGERVPLKQVLIAVKDAMEGTSTRPIANLGIKMRQGKGADGLNSYLYSTGPGKFVTETSAKTPEATLEALVRIINAKYAGLATAQAKTVPGGFEQIKKLIYLFQMKVADAGVIDWTLKQMNRFFAWVRQASASGALDRLANQVARFVTTSGDKLIAFLRDTDWAKVGEDIKLLAQALVLVAAGIVALSKLGGGGLHGLFNLWLVSKIVRVGVALFRLWPVLREGLSLLRFLGPVLAWVARGIAALFTVGEPIGWIAIAIVGLGAAGIYLWKHWQQAVAFFRATMPALVLLFGPLVEIPRQIMDHWGALKGFFRGVWKSISSWQPPAWMQLLAGVAIPGGMPLAAATLANGVAGSSWAQMLRGGAPRPGPARPTGRPMPAHDPYAGAHVTRGGGTMTIEFKNAPPHRVTKLAPAPGWSLDLNRGPIRTSGW